MSKVIVIAEDFDTSRKLVCQLFERSGYKVLAAADGVEAYSYFEKGEQIDLLITDYNMPRKNGGELIKAVRGIPAYVHMPIFVLSTERSKAAHEEAEQSNITAWIAKPYEVEKLLKMTARVLR